MQKMFKNRSFNYFKLLFLKFPKVNLTYNPITFNLMYNSLYLKRGKKRFKPKQKK